MSSTTKRRLAVDVLMKRSSQSTGAAALQLMSAAATTTSRFLSCKTQHLRRHTSDFPINSEARCSSSSPRIHGQTKGEAQLISAASDGQPTERLEQNMARQPASSPRHHGRPHDAHRHRCSTTEPASRKRSYSWEQRRSPPSSTPAAGARTRRGGALPSRSDQNLEIHSKLRAQGPLLTHIRGLYYY